MLQQCCDEENDIEMVKIHCDWLKDECYEKFRRKRETEREKERERQRERESERERERERKREIM